MRSSRQRYLETIEQPLKRAAGFQLHAARHKVFVIRDILTDNQGCCVALLLKIAHLLREAFIAPASRSAPTISE